MRDLGVSEYKVEVFDSMTGDTHVIRYRAPSNDDIVAYQVALTSGARPGRHLDRKKFAQKLYSTQLNFGSKIITGFEKGSFALGGKPISSDPNDPDYYPDWLPLLIEKAPQIVVAVANAAFGGGSVGYEEDTDDK